MEGITLLLFGYFLFQMLPSTTKENKGKNLIIDNLSINSRHKKNLQKVPNRDKLSVVLSVFINDI